MKHILTTGLLCSLLFSGLAALAQDQGMTPEPIKLTKESMIVGGDGPMLAAPEHVWNFDKAKQGEVLEHKFEIRNLGKADLKLIKVEPDCGCLVVDYPHTPIPSGEKAIVTLKFMTNGRLGPQTKRVKILTNEPAKKEHFLEIKGEILAPQAAPAAKAVETPGTRVAPPVKPDKK